MDIFLLYLLAGLFTGALAGRVMKNQRLGLLGSQVLGVLGAMLGGYIYDFFALEIAGLLGTLIFALMGAMVLLYLAQVLNRF